MALTPYGRDYFIGWWHSITFPRAAVAEWAPLVDSPYVLGLAAFGLAVLLAIYAVARRGPRACAGLLFVAATAWAAWRHERHVALFALAWFCAVPGWLAATPLGAMLDGALARRRAAALVASRRWPPGWGWSRSRCRAIRSRCGCRRRAPTSGAFPWSTRRARPRT